MPIKKSSSMLLADESNLQPSPSQSPSRSIEFELEAGPLLLELQLLSFIAGNGNSESIPVLGNVLINAFEDQRIELTGCNLDIFFKTEVGATITDPGCTLVSAKDLVKILRHAASSDLIRFSTLEDNAYLRIITPGSDYELRTGNPEEFPAFPSADNCKSARIPAEQLGKAINAVIFAVTEDEQRYAMTGALMKVDGNSLQIVATDSHRLCYINPRTDDALSEAEISAIVPLPVLNQLIKLISYKENETVELKTSDSFGVISTSKRLIAFRNMEAVFPNHQRFIDLENKTLAIAETKSLRAALTLVTTLATARTPGILFIFSENRLALSWENGDGNNANTSIPIDYTGLELAIGFNYRYILDFLSAVETDQVVFALNTDCTASILKPAGENLLNHRCVIMPMRVRT